jgi:hypothetical protein
MLRPGTLMGAVNSISCQQQTLRCCARTAKAHPYTAWPCRRFMFGPGTLTGATDFVLRQQRTFRVAAYEGKVRALCMHRSDFEALSDKDPEVRHRIDTSEHEGIGLPRAPKCALLLASVTPLYCLKGVGTHVQRPCVSISSHLALQPACCYCARLMWYRCLQAMIVLLTMLTRTSVVDATHVWEQLARQNASTP